MSEIIYSKEPDKNAEDFSKYFSAYKTKNCIASDYNRPTCRLTEDKIKSITYFLTSVITKCKSTNITLENIKNAKIIGKGTYGYGLSVGDKIIKIIICEKSIDKELLKEIEYNKIITNSDNEYFIKLIGYFIKDKDIYKYFDNTDNFSDNKCYTSKVNLSNLCEIYLILEKGDYGDITQYFKDTTFENYVNSFYNVLNMYTINKYFINLTKNIFIHCDIKSDNIVVLQDKLKIIDFGMAFITDKFFTEHHHKITFYKILYKSLNDTDIIYISPLYDLLCIIYTFWRVVLKHNLYIYDNRLFREIRSYINEHIKFYSDEIITILFRLLNIFKLIYELHIFFYNIQNIFKDKKFLEDFVDIRMIKIIYDKIFNKFESDNFPLYISTGDKLNDAYKYFDNIMIFLKNIDYRDTLYDIDIKEYDEILISYIETRKFDEKYLFKMINILTSNTINKKIIEYILIRYPSYIDELNNNSLHYAISMNLSENIIDNILDKVDINNINNVNKYGNTVLYYAIITRNIKIIKKLFDKNINVNIINSKDSLLYLCIKNYILDKDILNKDILNKLIENTKINLELILFAIQQNVSIDVIENMIDKFDINFKDSFGDNILMILLNGLSDKKFINYLPYIELMINKIDINHKNNKNHTVLDIILLNNNINKQNKIILIKKLMEKKIDFTNENLVNTSRLILAIHNKLPIELLEKFINPNTINVIETHTHLNALIHILILMGNNSDNDYTADLIKKLLDNGADKRYITPNRRTALSYALYTKNIDIIKMVYDEKIINVNEIININMLDKDEINNIDNISDINVTILDRALNSKNNVNVFGLLLIYRANLLKRHIIKIVNRFTIQECIELFKLNFQYNKNNIMDLKLNFKLFLEKYKNKYENIYIKYNKIYEKYRIIRKELKKYNK